MKKFFTGFAAIAMVLTCVCMSSCKNDRISNLMAELNGELMFDSVVFNDSVGFGEGVEVTVDLNVAYPISGNKTLTDSINAWICCQLEDTALVMKDDVKGLVKNYGALTFGTDSAEVAAILKENESEEEINWLHYCLEKRIKVVYEDTCFVTIRCFTFRDMGGAHGFPYQNTATFYKTGDRIGCQAGWDLTAKIDDETLDRNLKKELMQYCNAESEDALCEELFSKEGGMMSKDEFKNHFPLPVTPPYLTKEGIMVIYQMYEIGPYAFGMPECVIGQWEGR